MRRLLALALAATLAACIDHAADINTPRPTACAGAPDRTEALAKTFADRDPAGRPQTAAELARRAADLSSLREGLFDACEGKAPGMLR